MWRLLQEVSFPFFRITLQFKSPLEFLFLLTLPVGIVEFAVPGIAFIILIAWHVVISPFTPWGGVNIWKIMVLLILSGFPILGSLLRIQETFLSVLKSQRWNTEPDTWLSELKIEFSYSRIYRG